MTAVAPTGRVTLPGAAVVDDGDVEISADPGPRPLTGGMSAIELPDSCPTCGAVVEDASWPALETLHVDDAELTERQSGPMVLQPCGHEIGAG